MGTEDADATPPVSLAIAGSDSGGGAGIQADGKAMSWAGVHGCTAITALTAQNSQGVDDIHPVPPSFVSQQIGTVIRDFSVESTKTGMLFSKNNIEAILGYRKQFGELIVDPVMVAASGDSLMEEEAEEFMVRELLPEADLITPNIPEMKKILRYYGYSPEINFSSSSAIKHGMEKIFEALDYTPILLKGGHLSGEKIIDRLIHQENTIDTFVDERIDTEHTHGSGCVLSSLIAAHCARDFPMKHAVEESKTIVTEAIKKGYASGEGRGTLNLVRN